MGSVQARPPPHISFFGYGFHMWVSSGENQWYFNGMYGQNMILYRKEKIVIVCNASNSDMIHKSPVFALCENVFLGSDRSSSDSEKLGTVLKHLRRDRLQPRRFGERFFRPESQKLKSLLHKKLTTEAGNKDFSVGLIPRMMQSIENRYTTGVTEIAFAKTDRGFWMI